jgi:hypothetical protein
VAPDGGEKKKTTTRESTSWSRPQLRSSARRRTGRYLSRAAWLAVVVAATRTPRLVLASASPITLRLPAENDHLGSFEAGDVFTLAKAAGAGPITIVPAEGVMIHARTGLGQLTTLRRVAQNIWLMEGDLNADLGETPVTARLTSQAPDIAGTPAASLGVSGVTHPADMYGSVAVPTHDAPRCTAGMPVISALNHDACRGLDLAQRRRHRAGGGVPALGQCKPASHARNTVARRR